MSNDNKVEFLVIATFPAPSGYSRPFFVCAESIADAITIIITKDPRSFQTPRIVFDVHVLGPEMLRDVVPDVKAIAKAYFAAGSHSGTDAHHEETFDEVWDEHGPGIVDEDDAEETP
jgi:hypothetical protein